MMKVSLSLILTLFFSLQVQAEKMDSETQNMVIERLERILSLMEKKNSSWVPTNLRYADLLSERARLRFMNEIEANCQNCKNSAGDRKRALKIYEQILPKARKEMHGAIFFQMGHLYQIAGETQKAALLFHKVLSAKRGLYTEDLIRRARTSIADLEFERGQYQKAFHHYKIALQDPKTPNRELIQYRQAWCQFNLDQLKAATRLLEKVASLPSLETGFRNDVLRDLATFYARQKVGKAEIARYQELLPPSERKELLFFFATETSRLGQKKEASEIYRAYLSTPGLSKEERLEATLMLAQTEYEKDGSSQSIESFALAAQSYRKMNCKNEEKCVELRKRMKHYVTELHRSKKVQPDLNVLKAYQVYVETFPEETEMSLLGAQVADQLNQSTTASQLYHQSAESAPTAELREAALTGEISNAEKTHDPVLRGKAYAHYLKLNPQGPKNFEVRYQLAHIAYEQKNYSDAAEQFKTLALDKSGPENLRKSSADLALDCLAIQKDDSTIEKWAQAFAVALPKDRAEFDRISRKAVINQVAQTANNRKSSTSDQERALEKLAQTNLSTANEIEKALHYRNMLVLAEKVDSEKYLTISVGGLLQLKSTSAQDKEAYLARAVGFYERRLDFKTAYSYAKKMKFTRLSAAERELRLATIADLANLPAISHYQKAIRLGLKRSADLAARQRLILLSSNKSREFKKHQDSLLKSSALFNETLLLVYAAEGRNSQLRAVLSSRKFSGQAAVRFINKQAFLRDHQALAAKVSDHQLDLRNDQQMARSIQARLKLLKLADQSLDQALRLKDTTAQILALNTISSENHRLALDISKTPMPKGLTPVEQKKYVQLLSLQTRPFVKKAMLAQKQLQSLWNQERYFISLMNDFERSRAEIQRLLQAEIQLLANLSPNVNLKNRLQSVLRQDTPSMNELMAIRSEIRENPTDFKQIEKLKNLETKIGHPLMGPYLQGRLEQIKKERVL